MNLSDYTGYANMGGGGSSSAPGPASSASSRVTFGNNGPTITPEAALVGGLALLGLLLAVFLLRK